MALAPETAVSPVASAPPDRASLNVEEWARQGIALLFGDRVLDQNERRVLRGLMEEIALRAQAGGGIGNGATPPTEPAAAATLPPSPDEMNENVEDYGAGQGEPMEEY